MTKNFQEINVTSDPNRSSKFGAKKQRMSVVKCVCGYEILVVPDLKAMNRAIKHHVAEHKQSNEGSKRLTDFLTKQVLIVASKINLPNVY